MSTQDYHILNDNEGIWLPVDHVTVTSKESKYDTQPIKAQELIQEQAKDS